MTFAQPIWFWALLVLPVFLLLKTRGYLGFSDHRLLGHNPVWLKLLSRVPLALMSLTMILAVVALARPQIPGEPVHRTTPGRDIILAVDISFSMSFPFKGQLLPYQVPPELAFKVPFNERRRVDRSFKFEQPKTGLQRIHASQNALLQFIENRWRGQTGDRIGLIVFDVCPRYGWPITDDLRMLYRKAQFIQSNLGTATNFGRNPPGPIDLAVEHFQEFAQAKSRVLVLVTDGEDDIDPETKRRLIKLVQENNIRFYLVGIGETLARKDVDIIRFAADVGGHVFRVEDTSSLNKCFETIDRLEKSELTVSELETRDDVFFYFAWAAVACLGLFLLSETFILTR